MLQILRITFERELKSDRKKKKKQSFDLNSYALNTKNKMKTRKIQTLK